MSIMFRRPRESLLIGIVLAAAAIAPAASVSANIAKTYQTTSTIPSGSIVSLVPGRSGYVSLASYENGGSLLGIATEDNSSAVVINPAPNKVQVLLAGSASLLVSDLNGPVKSGDQISISPIKGVGMKAEPGFAVLGTAQGAYNGHAKDANTIAVKNTQGRITQAAIGYVMVEITIGAHGAAGSSGDGVVNTLVRSASLVAGRDVPVLAAVLSAVIAFVSLVALIVLIYGATRGSLISIGRNPLARVAIFESLAQVMAIATLIVATAILSIYLILR